jgi:hypothetical protein
MPNQVAKTSIRKHQNSAFCVGAQSCRTNQGFKSSDCSNGGINIEDGFADRALNSGAFSMHSHLVFTRDFGLVICAVNDRARSRGEGYLAPCDRESVYAETGLDFA